MTKTEAINYMIESIEEIEKEILSTSGVASTTAKNRIKKSETAVRILKVLEGIDLTDEN